MTPRVYLQTQNAHGSWVTPRDKGNQRLEFAYSDATLLHLAASPANARLVSVTTHEVVATKAKVEMARARLRTGYVPPVPTPKVRPVIRKPHLGVLAPVVIPEPKNHIASWWAGTISPARTHITGHMLVATQDVRFEPPKKRVSAR